MGKKDPPRHRELSFVKDAAGIHEEIDGASDRTRALVAVAYIENNLVLAIMTRLRELDAANQKLLFEDEHAFLRDFAAKVDLGYALNLYDHNVREDLHRLRKVRNKFAHDLEVRDFDHPLVSRYCDKLIGADCLDLPKGKIGPRTRRERFVDLAFHFGERFAMVTKHLHRPPQPTNRIGADY